VEFGRGAIQGVLGRLRPSAHEIIRVWSRRIAPQEAGDITQEDKVPAPFLMDLRLESRMQAQKEEKVRKL
jgi:hypothetical protein